MSERAYSIELKREIAAKDASNLSLKGKLEDSKAFRCADPNCEIDLTCTNWNRKGIKYYFTPSSKNELHIVGCTQVSASEAREQSIRESQCAKETLKKNGIIKMTKSISKARTNIKEKIGKTPQNTADSSESLTKNKQLPKEYRQLYSLASFVDLFNDNEVNNDTQFVAIEKNKKVSLNTLFVSSSLAYISFGVTRIFYGKALLKTSSTQKGMLEIEFLNSGFPRIYSNIPILLKRSVTLNLSNYLDKNKYAYVFFRGSLDNGGKKFTPFNDKVYKDLLFFNKKLF